MAPSGSEHPTNRRNGRSILASGRPERVAQVRTRRTAPPDQPAADPSSLPVSRPRDPMNQRTPSASTGEFFNTIGAKRTFQTSAGSGAPHIFTISVRYFGSSAAISLPFSAISSGVGFGGGDVRPSTGNPTAM